MKQYFTLFFLLALFQGCTWELPGENKLKICQKPTAIVATPDATNPLKYTLSLSESTTDIASIVWSVSGNSDQPQTGYNTKTVTVTYNTSYDIKAIITTSCKETISLQLTLKVNVPIPTKQWDKTFGGNNDEALSSSIQTSDGGYLLLGYSNSGTSGEKSVNSKGGYDFWVVKIDANGTKQWDKTLGVNGNDYLRCAISTTDGGYLLAGDSNSDLSGDKSENPKGGYDFWIVKINATGTKQWDKTFGGNNDEILKCAIPTADGGYLLGGSSLSPISGDKSENPKGGYDYWVMKINANGTKQWDKTFGGNSNDRLNAVLSSTDGGYLLAGNSASGISGDKSEVLQGGPDYWVVKINANGTKQWDKTFGGNGNEALSSSMATNDGGYLLVGDSNSDLSGDKSKGSQYLDYWVVKINATGTKQWDKTLGGDLADYSRSATATTDGGYLLGGYSYSSASGDKSENSQYADYWAVKIDANGVKQWDKTFGGNDLALLTNVINTTDTGYLLGGISASNISKDKSENSRGGSDYWIVKLK